MLLHRHACNATDTDCRSPGRDRRRVLLYICPRKIIQIYRRCILRLLGPPPQPWQWRLTGRSTSPQEAQRYWESVLEGIDKPNAMDLRAVLDMRHLLGMPPARAGGNATYGSGRGRQRAPLFAFFCAIKAQHPTKVTAGSVQRLHEKPPYCTCITQGVQKGATFCPLNGSQLACNAYCLRLTSCEQQLPPCSACWGRKGWVNRVCTGVMQSLYSRATPTAGAAGARRGVL